MTTSELRVPALEIRQGPNRKLYSFAIDGKVLHNVASVSRLRRDDNKYALGYQRPEVLSHVNEIRNYVESKDPLIPNALVVAFDDRVRFEPLKDAGGPHSRHGELVIPIPSKGERDKPGWIVDGQQRAAAIREAKVVSFPVCVTAFITGDEQEQREQFILVNSTKPLPRSLIYELLPSTTARLPSQLQRRRFPAGLCEMLNREPTSPFFGRIQTATNPGAKIKDNSILRMLENSLSNGALYRFRGSLPGTGDEQRMFSTLRNFWVAVAQTWPEAWTASPRKSRLTHGAGIVAMGVLMDAIDSLHQQTGAETSFEKFIVEVQSIRPYCHWTSGTWSFGGGVSRAWNEIQNTSKDIDLLSNFLQRQYLRTARDD